MTDELAAPRRPRRENALVSLARIQVVRRIWASTTFSSFGDWLGLLANTALAQQLTHHQSVATQGAAISGVILVRLAPDLVFGPIAAAMSDKLDRRKLVIGGDLAAGLLYATIAIGYNLVWLYIAQFLIEAVGLFTQPAKQVIQVAIVPKKLLATANQVSLISVYGTVPIAAGVFALLSAVDRLLQGKAASTATGVGGAIVVALLLDTLTFAVSSMTVYLSRADIPVAPASREQEQGILTLLREGVSFVRRHALIRGLYVGIIGAFAAGGLTVGVAQLWVATLSAGAAGYSIMFGTVFTGLAVGMLLGPKILPAYTRNRVFGFAIGCAGITLLVMSVIRDFILAVGLAALVGAFAGMAWIIGYTLIGQEVEDRLRGRIFAFVLSSVRITLLLTIAIGPVLAGLIGAHAIPFGGGVRLRLSGPGITLLIGSFVAMAVSYYAAIRATRSRARLRDLLRRRIMRAGVGERVEHAGVFITVEGLNPEVTAAYTQLVLDALEGQPTAVIATREPTDSPLGRRVVDMLQHPPEGGEPVSPETAALLSAADRAEHVANVIRPALVRGEIVVCNRYLLTSLAVHGGGTGADVERIRSVNNWSTGALLPTLSLVIADGPFQLPPEMEPDAESMRAVLIEAAEADPDRCLRCPSPAPDHLPDQAAARLAEVVSRHASSGSSRRALSDADEGAIGAR